MAKALKVWGMTGSRGECPAAPNGGKQTREVVAAPSAAAAARAFGVSSAYLANWGSETGNGVEVALALSKPGTVFWRPLHLSPGTARWIGDAARWTEAAPSRHGP